MPIFILQDENKFCMNRMKINIKDFTGGKITKKHFKENHTKKALIFAKILCKFFFKFEYFLRGKTRSNNLLRLSL